MKRDQTVIERLDPRVKFLTLLILSVQIFGFGSSVPLSMAAVVLVLAVVSARTPLRLLWKRMLSVSVFLLLICATNLFTVSGDVLFEFAGLYATREGFNQGAILSSRILLLLMGATVFVRTTSAVAMIDGIEISLRPFREYLGPIIQVLTLALNFVPLLILSAQQLKKAQIARGAEPDRSLARQIRFAVSATVPLFVMTLRASEHLALAMDARCYQPRAKRSSFAQLQMTTVDWMVLGVVVVQFLVSSSLRR
jgi:energy-coupling factor transport system permease protein